MSIKMIQHTIEGFKDFINSQDPNRNIDHDTWYTCATGEYLESGNDYSPELRAFTDMLLEEYYALWTALNEKWERFPTYKELQEFIK